MEPSRKFKIIINSKECGTCSGPTPSAVAKKVVKKLCGKSNKTVKFSLKECKRGCERICGPYQGRMEKLNRPYKRSGKTITHRVICGKVRKMRGGGLSKSDFIKRDDDPYIKYTLIGLRPHIFFGDKRISVRSDNVIKCYRFVIFNIDHFGENKKVGIKDNNLNDIEIMFLLKNQRYMIIKLYELINFNRTTPYYYKSIMKFLEDNFIKDISNTIGDDTRISVNIIGDISKHDYSTEIIKYLPNPILFKKLEKDNIITCRVVNTDRREIISYYYIKNDFIFFSNNMDSEYYNYLLFFNNKNYIVIYNNTENQFFCYCFNEVYHDESINNLLISIFPLLWSLNNNVYDMATISKIIIDKMKELINFKYQS